VAEQLTEEAQPAAAAGRRRTIGALWRDAVAARHPGPAYLVESADGWREISWAEADRRIDELARGFLQRGIGKGDPVAILAATRLEWVLADFALALIGAVPVGIYPTSSVAETAHILAHCGAVAAIVDSEEQRAKVERARAEAPALALVLGLADLEELAAEGRAAATERPRAVDDAAALVDEDDVFTYIYTSGTTGPPKGCTILHRHYYSMVSVVAELEDFTVRGDRLLLFLPLAHNFGRAMHLGGPFAGYAVALLPDPLRAAEALVSVSPTVFPSVPRVYEKIYAVVVAAFAETSGARRRLVDWALDVGRRVSRLRQDGKPVPPALAARHALANRLVYRKVKARLGGRLRTAISGGAPLSPEIAEFFHALDILILEGYGLTECTTAATVNRHGRYRFGSVGPALPGCELRIAEDGEVLIHSPTVFAGYLKEPEATRAVLGEDGWLRSGDVGRIDEDGFLWITDRKRDMLVTAGGKNVSPQNLENALKNAPEISQALVVGDRRPYVAALVTLDVAATGGLSVAEVESRVQGAVDRVNAEVSRAEQIKRFAVLPRDFSIEHGEVGPTLKLKRRVAEEHFAAEIEALYT
jgi:long-chain acyl-CoA synthetase